MRVWRSGMPLNRWGSHGSGAMRFCGRLGRPAGSPVGRSAGRRSGQVVAVFTATGRSIRRPKAAGVSMRRAAGAGGRGSGRARPPAVWQGAARARFLELLASGWSAARAAREVGVHVRTGRDWRDGIRKIRNTRIHPDGTVIDYTTGTRYTQPVITSHAHPDTCRGARGQRSSVSVVAGSTRDRRRACSAGQTLTGSPPVSASTPPRCHARSVAHSIDGLYLPYQADTAAARTAPAPSSPNWSPTRICARRSKTGCRGGCPPSRSPTVWSRTSRTTRACG